MQRLVHQHRIDLLCKKCRQRHAIVEDVKQGVQHAIDEATGPNPEVALACQLPLLLNIQQPGPFNDLHDDLVWTDHVTVHSKDGAC